MLIRFVAPLPEEPFRWTGVFQVAWCLRDDGRLADYEEEWFAGTLAWFNRELAVPHRLSRSRRAGAKARAVCWFKSSAARYIGKVRELTALLEQHGIPSTMLRTARPGYIVYEDAAQVAALPFRDTVSP